MNIPLSPYVPENLVSLARRVQPSRPASACLFCILRLNLVLTYGIPPEFRVRNIDASRMSASCIRRVVHTYMQYNSTSTVLLIELYYCTLFGISPHKSYSTPVVRIRLLSRKLGTHAKGLASIATRSLTFHSLENFDTSCHASRRKHVAGKRKLQQQQQK